MKQFSELFRKLDQTTRKKVKVTALRDYFQSAEPADAVWALALLSGRRQRQVISSSLLKTWARETADIPDWLFEECYSTVGDLSETIAKVVPFSGQPHCLTLAEVMERYVLGLVERSDEAKRALLLEAWRLFGPEERLIFNKLVRGGFRVGVSKELTLLGLSQATDIDVAVLAHRTMGHWEPTPTFWSTLTDPDTKESAESQPYPFALAYPLEDQAESLGDLTEWQAEWKWDGIRAQVISRGSTVAIWTRGEELVTERYPEIAAIGSWFPDGTVLDGEILAWQDDKPLPFSVLQTRIGRKAVTAGLMKKAPVTFLAYDLLEFNRVDWRSRPLLERRAKLEALGNKIPKLRLSETIKTSSWSRLEELRGESRQRRVEGLMLKRLSSPYGVGRKKGDWWKWKVSPYTIDAVLVYAQRGSGKRAGLYTDYTFAIWDEEENLVPFAKAYSGLTDAEIREVDRFIRKNTKERFGPVRTVKPELVFELAFEGIQESTRHKSGIAVRFPRILRWRQDLGPKDADRLHQVRDLIDGTGSRVDQQEDSQAND